MGKIDMFEHLRDPLNTLPLETSYRLWRAMPYFAMCVTDHIVDLLKEKGFWRQALKQDFNRAIKCISPQSDALVQRLFKQEQGDDYVPLNFETALCEKFITSFLEYYQRLMEIAAVAEEPDLEKKNQMYVESIVGKTQFMITLQKGDVFTFADTGKYEEFTYNGYASKYPNDIVCEYISTNEHDGPQLFLCENIWRPVIRMNIK